LMNYKYFRLSAVALMLYSRIRPMCQGPREGVLQQQLARSHEDLAAPGLRRRQFLQEVFPLAKAEAAAQVGDRWVIAVLDIVQKLQGRLDGPGDPGGVVHHPLLVGGTVDAGQHGGSLTVHQCPPRTFSISSGLSWTP